MLILKRLKQNHKISYQFFAAPPCTPRRFFERKEIFGFGLRLEGARGALYSLHHAIGAYAEGLHHHTLGACDYFSLRSKKVRISSYRRSHSEQSANSCPPTAEGNGKSARIFHGFCHKTDSARSRKSGFEPIFLRKSLFAGRFSFEAIISACLLSKMKSRIGSSQSTIDLYPRFSG